MRELKERGVLKMTSIFLSKNLRIFFFFIAVSFSKKGNTEKEEKLMCLFIAGDVSI